jgi:hypothetical protein
MAILHHHLLGNKADVCSRKLHNERDLRETGQIEVPGHHLLPDPLRLVQRGKGLVRLVDFRAGPA